MANNKNIWRTLFMAAFVIIIVILFFLLVEVDEVIQLLAAAKPGYLIAASIALILGLIFFAARWRVLLENKPGLLFTFHACNLGHAGNILIPFRAGEAIRILVMGSAKIVTYTEATTSFVVERLFEQILRLSALGLAVFVGVGLDITPATVLGGVGVLVLGFGAIAWLVGNQRFTLQKGTRILAKLPRVTEEMAYKWISDFLWNLETVSKPGHFTRVLFLSLVTWFLFWCFYYLTLLSLDISFPLTQRLAVSSAALALSPPSATTQPGIFHASIVVPLAAVGFDAAVLTAYAVLLHLVEMFWVIGFAIWGLIATGSSLADIFRVRA